MAKRKTILSAARVDDRLAEMKALRVRLATALDDPDTAARDLSSLARRLMDVGREVEELESREPDNDDHLEGDAPFDPSTV